MRWIGLDVHQGFCPVAIREAGKTRSAGRVETDRAELELFARSLDRSDQVVLEASGPALEIARIVEPHGARVVVGNPSELRAIAHARVKSDRFDARTLAELGDAGVLEAVWVPPAEIAALRRRVARRAALARQRTRAKNEVHAVLARCLLGRSPVADLFGRSGRAWLSRQAPPAEERETVDGCLRQLDFLDAEIRAIDRRPAGWALSSPEARRPMTIPGVGVGTAVTSMAAIGEIARFSSPRKLVAYLGLDPGCASPATSRPATGGSRGAATRRRAACWSRPPGRRSGSPGPCAPSASGSAPAGGPRWRPWRWRAS
jgi:transposase